METAGVGQSEIAVSDMVDILCYCYHQLLVMSYKCVCMLCVHVCVWRVYMCYTVAYSTNICITSVLSNVYIL